MVMLKNKYSQDMMHVLKNAFDNLETNQEAAQYFENTLKMRNPSSDSADSVFLEPQTKESLKNANWTPYTNPNVNPPVYAFKANIPGTLKAISIDDLSNDKKVYVRLMHGGGAKIGDLVELVGNIGSVADVDFTVMLIGPEDFPHPELDNWLIYTFHPGNPAARPKEIRVSDVVLDENMIEEMNNGGMMEVTVGEAKDMGFTTVKHMDNLPSVRGNMQYKNFLKIAVKFRQKYAELSEMVDDGLTSEELKSLAIRIQNNFDKLPSVQDGKNEPGEHYTISTSFKSLVDSINEYSDNKTVDKKNAVLSNLGPVRAELLERGDLAAGAFGRTYNQLLEDFSFLGGKLHDVYGEFYKPGDVIKIDEINLVLLLPGCALVNLGDGTFVVKEFTEPLNDESKLLNDKEIYDQLAADDLELYEESKLLDENKYENLDIYDQLKYKITEEARWLNEKVETVIFESQNWDQLSTTELAKTCCDTLASLLTDLQSMVRILYDLGEKRKYF